MNVETIPKFRFTLQVDGLAEHFIKSFSADYINKTIRFETYDVIDSSYDKFITSCINEGKNKSVPFAVFNNFYRTGDLVQSIKFEKLKLTKLEHSKCDYSLNNPICFLFEFSYEKANRIILGLGKNNQ